MRAGTKPPPLLTKTDILEMFGISNSALDKWIKARTIPYIKLKSGSVRFRQSEIDQFLDSRTIKAKRGF